MVTAKDPLRVALNKVYPATVYARPAVAPLVVGVGGTVGKAQANLNEMYKYTLQQMAVSPFSVNSEEYMKRIRNEYGYSDSGMYEAMGTVGSVVGACVGAFLGSGALKGSPWRFWWKDSYNIFKPTTWAKDNWQAPFKLKDRVELVNPFKSGGSKRQQTSEAFRQRNTPELNKFINKHKNIVQEYNKALTEYNGIKKEEVLN